MHGDEYLQAAEEGRLAAERLQRLFDERVWEANTRYLIDPEYHARVYQVARVIDNDRDFIDVNETAARVDRGFGPQWEFALGLALKAVVASDEMQPGGIFDLQVRS